MKKSIVCSGVLVLAMLLSACGAGGSATGRRSTTAAPLAYLLTTGQLSAWHTDTGARAWQVALPFGATPHAVLAGAMLYVAAGGVTALRASDGKQVWHVDLQHAEQASDVAVADGDLYLNTSTEMYAFSLIDGTLRWRYDHALAIPALIVDQETVYLTANDVIALKASDGTKVWDTPLAEGFYTTQAATSLLLVGTTLYVQSQESALYALDTTTGKSRWAYQSAGGLSAPLIDAQGTVYLATFVVPVVAQGNVGPTYTLMALKPADGLVAWKMPFTIGNQPYNFTPAPVLAGNTLYAMVGPTAGDVVAVNPADGTVRWHMLGTATGQQLAAVDAGVAIALQDGSIIDYAASGSVRWRLPGQSGAAVLLTQHQHTVYSIWASGQFAALDPATGKPHWQSSLGGGGFASALLLPAEVAV